MLKPPTTPAHTHTPLPPPAHHTTHQHTEQKSLGVIIHDGDHGECTGVERLHPPPYTTMCARAQKR
jgi:hypothetical protein